MHRRKDLSAPNAKSFHPARWEDLIYGGPRACLGQEFALLEAGYTIVGILEVCESIEMVGGEVACCWTEETGASIIGLVWRCMLRIDEELLTYYFKEWEKTSVVL